MPDILLLEWNFEPADYLNSQLLPVSASMNSQLNGDAFNVRFWSMLNLMTIGFVREPRLISGWLRSYLPLRHFRINPANC
jgi:hypothetical protein